MISDSRCDKPIEAGTGSDECQSHARLDPCQVLHKSADEQINPGMPPLLLGNKPVSYFEFWPAWLFYVPVVLYWILLSLRYRNFALPMLANPHIELGGMVGESKTAILNQAGALAKKTILPYLVATKTPSMDEADMTSLLAQAARQGITMPMIVKPDLGCRGAGVRLVKNAQALSAYLRDFPLGRQFLLQKLAPFAAEAGVFYERMPGDACGAITSITLKYRPFVVGDGVHSLGQLIIRDPRAKHMAALYLQNNDVCLASVPAAGEAVAIAFAGSHCRGSIFRDGNTHITPELTAAIDAVMQDFPAFHYGRLDVKFSDIASLMRGENFVVIEVNGASSEKTHIWDSRTSIWQVFRTLLAQYRTLFVMGDLMRKRGVKPPTARRMIRTWLRELKAAKGYPSTS